MKISSSTSSPLFFSLVLLSLHLINDLAHLRSSFALTSTPYGLAPSPFLSPSPLFLRLIKDLAHLQQLHVGLVPSSSSLGYGAIPTLLLADGPATPAGHQLACVPGLSCVKRRCNGQAQVRRQGSPRTGYAGRWGRDGLTPVCPQGSVETISCPSTNCRGLEHTSNIPIGLPLPRLYGSARQGDVPLQTASPCPLPSLHQAPVPAARPSRPHQRLHQRLHHRRTHHSDCPLSQTNTDRPHDRHDATRTCQRDAAPLRPLFQLPLAPPLRRPHEPQPNRSSPKQSLVHKSPWNLQ